MRFAIISIFRDDINSFRVFEGRVLYEDIDRVTAVGAYDYVVYGVERGVITVYAFIYIIFILNREISICMVSPFFNTDVFWSFYPRDYIYTFIY